MIMYSMQENKSLYFIVNVTMIIITIVERLRIGRECNKKPSRRLSNLPTLLLLSKDSHHQPNFAYFWKILLLGFLCLSYIIDNIAFRVCLFELHN